MHSAVSPAVALLAAAALLGESKGKARGGGQQARNIHKVFEGCAQADKKAPRLPSSHPAQCTSDGHATCSQSLRDGQAATQQAADSGSLCSIVMQPAALTTIMHCRVAGDGKLHQPDPVAPSLRLSRL